MKILKKRGQVIYERGGGGEGTSITEAPDMTAASSSPWRCCGRQRRTSLVETGDTKEEYDKRGTRNRREGGLEETCVCRDRRGWGWGVYVYARV